MKLMSRRAQPFAKLQKVTFQAAARNELMVNEADAHEESSVSHTRPTTTPSSSGKRDSVSEIADLPDPPMQGGILRSSR